MKGERSRLVGTISPWLALFAAGCIVGGFYFAFWQIAQPSTSLSGLLMDTAPIAAYLGVVSLALCMRVTVRPNQAILVTSLLVHYSIPLRDVTSVMTDSGLEIRLTSGRRIGTMAYGDSVLGQLFHHRRGKRAAARIERLTGVPVDAAPGNWKDESVTPALRVGALVVAACVAAALMGGTLIIHAVLA